MDKDAYVKRCTREKLVQTFLEKLDVTQIKDADIVLALNRYVETGDEEFFSAFVRWSEAYDKEKELQTNEEGLRIWEKRLDDYRERLESEDERIREALIRFHKSTIDIDGIKGEDIIAWLEKQCKPIDEEKVLIGARKDVALSIINYLDNNSVGMCLSNIECEDIEDACVNSKWIKLYNYMKKKLEKQGSPVLSNSSNIEKSEQKYYDTEKK